MFGVQSENAATNCRRIAHGDNRRLIAMPPLTSFAISRWRFGCAWS